MMIRIYDINGKVYVIESSDRETIQRWLGEIITVLAPNAAKFNMRLQFDISPSYMIDNKPDWFTNAGMMRYSLDEDGLRYMLQDLRRAGVKIPEMFKIPLDNEHPKEIE